MGQRFASDRSALDDRMQHSIVQLTLTNKAHTPHLMLLDFVNWMCGHGIYQMHFNLPLCWDELLDWTEQVTFLSSLLDNDKLLPPHFVGDDRILLAGRELPRFIPLVLRSAKEQLSEVKSMSWVSRARFFADSVIVSVARSDEIETVNYIQLRQFCRYHSLLHRLSDLYALRFNCVIRAETVDARSKKDECMLCCHETENAVLSCGHAMCTSCVKRWVKKQLVCPFCRQKFRSATDISRNGTWNLMDWADDAGLDDDIQALESKIEEFWSIELIDISTPASSTNQDTLRRDLYTEIPRLLAVINNDPDDYLMIEEQEGIDSLALTL